MYRKYKKTSKKRVYKKKNTVRKAIRRVKRTNFKKRVLSVIHSQAETKQAYAAQPLTWFNSSISSAGDALQIIPQITQGIADNQRIGDQIKAQSMKMKGYMIWTSTNLNQNYACRVAVRMFIVQPKKYATLTDIQANVVTWSSVLLKKGGTTVGFTGAISDIWAPVNTDAITCYKSKVYYLNQNYVATIGGTSGVNGTPYSTDMAKTMKTFSHSFKLRNKTIKFDASSDGGLLDTTFNPVLCIGYVFMDGTGADTVTTRLQVTYDSTFNYEDA